MLALVLLAAPLKEPAYEGKPLYAVLEFGKARAWLVLDGKTLYVDRDGDGDLTGPTKKVAAEKKGDLEFDAGELRIGGRTHTGLSLTFFPLKELTASILKREAVKAALAKRPDGLVASVSLEADVPGLRKGGRVHFSAGPVDAAGALLFADDPAKAPVIRCGGHLRAAFPSALPELRAGRETDVAFSVGCSGDGAGTFASIGYEGTIPEKVRASAVLGKERFEFKERC